MVRKQASAAIIAQSGMTLLEESVQGLQIDTPDDDRPLRNALRGRSQSDVSSVNEIVVQLDGPAIGAERLVLRQEAHIQLGEFRVVTRSTAATGNLQDYETTLLARPTGESTQVELSVTLHVHVCLPKLFSARANTGVQQAADRAIAGQAASMTAFVDQYSRDLLTSPQLK